MSRRLIAVLVVALGAAFFAPNAAQGAFGIKEWYALTCKENVNTPKLGQPPVAPPTPDPEACTPATPTKWYTQAAGHPPVALTDFTLNTYTNPLTHAIGFPEGFVKDIVVDTPEGLSVNPEALPQCPVALLETGPPPGSCPPQTLVGVNYFTVATEGPPCDNVVPDVCIQADRKSTRLNSSH